MKDNVQKQIVEQKLKIIYIYVLIVHNVGQVHYFAVEHMIDFYKFIKHEK